MPVADRTFSFRAPGALAERLARAEDAYAALSVDPEVAARISRELEIRLARRLRHADRPGGRGRLIRAVTEAFVEATERAQRDAALVADFREFDRQDTAGPGERAALLARAAARDA